MSINLENIPRTIKLTRAEDICPALPPNFPVLILLDQSKLPEEESYLFITDWRVALDAIKQLKVRGAPVIGITAAAILTLRAAEYVYAFDDTPSDEDDFDRVFVIDEQSFDPELYLLGMHYAAKMVVASRPTANSISEAAFACIEIVQDELKSGSNVQIIADRLYEFTCAMIVHDEQRCRMIGSNGASLLKDNSVVLTHCNAGSLATAYYGTALGIVYSAANAGKINRVYVDETRPVGQGCRLSAWELSRAGINVVLICDNMAATVIAKGDIDAVIVGADRIAANGDVANKIGTLNLAILASYFDIPFYVAAPDDTIDLSICSGIDIPIEKRDASEILEHPIDGVDVFNPAFDVTPANLVTAIITESGIYKPNEIADRYK